VTSQAVKGCPTCNSLGAGQDYSRIAENVSQSNRAINDSSELQVEMDQKSTCDNLRQ